MWNNNKAESDSFPSFEWIEKMADLLGLSNSQDDEASRLEREGNLIPVRVLHDGKHPNIPDNSR